MYDILMRALTPKEEEIRHQAVLWARKKANRRLVIQKFLDLDDYPSSGNPLVFFMAGSPGAGKTELSKELIKQLDEQGAVHHARIDPDEVRKELPGYTGKNAYIFQQPVSMLMDDLISFASKNHQSAIVDGTLANMENAEKNIQKIIDRNGKAAIVYVYQDPELAWRFTVEREAVEGRRIEKDTFIKALFSSKDNVDSLKQKFGSDLYILFVEKDYKKGIKNFKINVDDINQYVAITHTAEELGDML